MILHSLFPTPVGFFKLAEILEFLRIILQVEQLLAKTLVPDVFPASGSYHVGAGFFRGHAQRLSRLVQGVVDFAECGLPPRL